MAMRALSGAIQAAIGAAPSGLRACSCGAAASVAGSEQHASPSGRSASGPGAAAAPRARPQQHRSRRGFATAAGKQADGASTSSADGEQQQQRPRPRSAAEPRSVDAREIAKFAALADRWWDQAAGPFAPLHLLNAARCLFIRRAAGAALGGNGAASSSAASSAAEPLAGLTALDVGCGGGLLAEPLARMGARVTGIDLSPASVGAAAAHAAGDPALASRLDYRATSAEALLQISPGAFDLVVASEVIEHVKAPGAFLKTLAALAAPRGALIVSTLNRTPASYALAILGAERLTGLVPPGTHDWAKFLAPRELAMAAADAGLRVDQIAGMSMAGPPPPLPGARFVLTDDLSVNYIALLVRDDARGGGGGGGGQGGGSKEGGGGGGEAERA